MNVEKSEHDRGRIVFWQKKLMIEVVEFGMSEQNG